MNWKLTQCPTPVTLFVDGHYLEIVARAPRNPDNIRTRNAPALLNVRFLIQELYEGSTQRRLGSMFVNRQIKSSFK